MTNLPSIEDVELTNKTVLLRTGYDVPLDSDKDILDPKRVKDDSRIQETIPTLVHILKQNTKVILAAGWVGRPKGEDPELTMAPVALRLQEILKEKGLLKHPVLMAPNCLDGSDPRSVWNNKEEVKKIVSELKDGQVVVLENVRYDPEANDDDQKFAKFIASLAGENAVYVNEAEPQNHRPEATVVSVPKFIAKNNGKCCFGFKYSEVVKHMAEISHELEKKEKGSFVFFLAGKKIETRIGITSKISVTDNFLDKMKKGDVIVVLGGVTYTFLIANNYIDVIQDKLEDLNKLLEDENVNEKIKKLIGITDDDAKKLIGNSFAEWDQLGEQIIIAAKLILKVRKENVKILLPLDHTITNKAPDRYGDLPEDADIKVYDKAIGINKEWFAVAPGPKTLKLVCDEVKKSSMVLLAGPISIEDERLEKYSKSHKKLLAAIKKAKNNGAITIAAGGDTAAMVKELKGVKDFTVISSAGGATLELMESGTSKAIDAIKSISG